jgi:hypothetical protein
LIDSIFANPVRLVRVHAAQGEGGNHVLIEVRLGEKSIPLALSEADSRLLMEQLGAALTFFRMHPPENN